MANLEEVATNLLKIRKPLDSECKIAYELVLDKSKCLVEIMTFIMRTESPGLQPLLEPVIDEIFVDSHIAVSLALAHQFKTSLILGRVCAESALYLLYFIDHPVEARMWSDTLIDLSFSSILDAICKQGYLENSTDGPVNRDAIETINKKMHSGYRQLSERVHGKYEFLQVKTGSAKQVALSFTNILDEVFHSILKLFFIRTKNKAALKHEFPSVERFV